jgi:hypothetical protein
MSDGTNEASAVATSLLRRLTKFVSAQLAAADDDAASKPAADQLDAVEALAHALSLWERGLPVPA